VPPPLNPCLATKMASVGCTKPMNRESGSAKTLLDSALVSDTCRAPRPAAGALAVSEHRVAYVGAVAGEGDQDLPFSPSAGLLLDMSSVAMFLRTIGRFEWASDLPGMRRDFDTDPPRHPVHCCPSSAAQCRLTPRRQARSCFRSSLWLSHFFGLVAPMTVLPRGNDQHREQAGEIDS